MDIKKKISLILVTAILFGTMIVSPVFAGSTNITYVTVDLEPNSLAYTDAANYANIPIVNDEDYFRQAVANGASNMDYTYALDGDTVKALYTEGEIYYHNGVPYHWETDGAVGISGNGASGITASCHEYHSNHIQSATVDVPDGNYTKLNFLGFTTFSTKTQTADGKSPFYIEFIYEDGTVSTNMTLNSTDDLSKDTTIDQVVIKRWNTWMTANLENKTQTWLGKSPYGGYNNARVGVYSLDVDITKTLKEVRFYNKGTVELCWKAQMKVLALTLAQKSINDFIIETIPLPEEITLDNLVSVYEKIAVVDAMMTAQSKTEEDLTAEAKERLIKAREKCESAKADYINSLVEALPAPEAVDSVTFTEIMDQISKTEAEMVKYSITVENIREDLKTKISDLKAECEKIKYDYIDRLVKELPLPEEVTLDTYSDVEAEIEAVRAQMVKYDVLENDISEASKEKISALEERCDNRYYYHIEGLVEKLPLIEEVNPSTYYKVSAQIEDMEAQMETYGVSSESLSEASKEKITTLKAKLLTVKPTYTMFDISDYRTSKLFVYESQREDNANKINIKLNQRHDFLYDGGADYYNNFALSGDSLKAALGDDNIVEDKNHIPYLIDNDLVIPVSANYHGITGISKTTVDLPDGVYSSINFLAFSRAGGINYPKTTITLNYVDGTKTSWKEFPIKDANSKSDDEGFVFEAKSYVNYDKGWLETVSFEKASGKNGIYTYEVLPQNGKIVDSITFQNENDGYLGWITQFKVLAISAVDETVDKIANFTGMKLSELSNATNVSAEELKAIKANLDKLEGLNYDTSTLSNLSEFNGLYANLIEVNSYNVTSEADKVTVSVDLTTEALSFEKDKIKLYSGNNEIDSKYLDISFSGDNGNTKKMTLTFPNFLDYSSEYKVVLSKDITSAFDSRLTLSKDREVKFNILPTVKASEEKAVVNESKIAVEVIISNETAVSKPYAAMFGLYSKDGTLLDYVLDEGSLESSGNIKIARNLSIPENEENYNVEFYLLDSYLNRRLIWEPIVLIGG